MESFGESSGESIDHCVDRKFTLFVVAVRWESKENRGSLDGLFRSTGSHWKLLDVVWKGVQTARRKSLEDLGKTLVCYYSFVYIFIEENKSSPWETSRRGFRREATSRTWKKTKGSLFVYFGLIKIGYVYCISYV